MISLYISQKTWLHRVPAGAKLLALAMFSILVLPIGNVLFLALGDCLVTLVYLSMGWPGLNQGVGHADQGAVSISCLGRSIDWSYQ